MPVDEFGGDWTAEKLERVGKYLAAYTVIFARNPKAQKLIPTYVDAFAGTGYRTKPPRLDAQTALFEELAEPEAEALLKGSARIALEVKPPFKRYIFIEQDAKRASEFEKLKQQFPVKAAHVTIVREDANTYLRAWCQQTDWRMCRAVMFLGFIQRVFATMRACPQHTFQILTKRSSRLRRLASEINWPVNVWMGVSVEDSRVLCE